MKFGLLYEMETPRPWNALSEYNTYWQALAQIELADRIGIDYVWEVEHHFLEEYSHSSAPEVFYGAVSQRTKNIRIAHGVRLLPFNFNNPIKVAEQAAVLDIMSNGRMDLGTGRSTTAQELDGFSVDYDRTRAEVREALDIIVKAWTDEILEYDGKLIKVPPRRVVPKPIQKPHPPMWVAATQPTTWEVAGHKGIGALGFGISEPGVLDKLVTTYRNALKNCEPVGSFINARTAAATVCVCAPTREEAMRYGKDAIDFTTRKGAELFTPFAKREVRGYEYYKKMAEAAVALGDYRLSTEDLNKRIEAGAVMVGDPEDCLKVAKMYESAGVDLLLMLVQVGAIPHDKVLQTIDLIGKHVMPKLNPQVTVMEAESAAAAR
jgi:alkanesulfonate monooxygenase SsuD/methylene tetrahydromethanopterin reductase-like flavin-dependent oxidoreductase (luciferase family)